MKAAVLATALVAVVSGTNIADSGGGGSPQGSFSLDPELLRIADDSTDEPQLRHFSSLTRIDTVVSSSADRSSATPHSASALTVAELASTPNWRGSAANLFERTAAVNPFNYLHQLDVRCVFQSLEATEKQALVLVCTGLFANWKYQFDFDAAGFSPHHSHETTQLVELRIWRHTDCRDAEVIQHFVHCSSDQLFAKTNVLVKVRIDNQQRLGKDAVIVDAMGGRRVYAFGQLLFPKRMDRGEMKQFVLMDPFKEQMSSASELLLENTKDQDVDVMDVDPRVEIALVDAFIYSITSELMKLHGLGWIHADVDLENIVMNDAGTSFALADFKSAERNLGENTQFRSVPLSAAPPMICANKAVRALVDSALANDQRTESLSCAQLFANGIDESAMAAADFYGLGITALNLALRRETGLKQAIEDYFASKPQLEFEECALCTDGTFGALSEMQLLYPRVAKCLVCGMLDDGVQHSLVPPLRRLIDLRFTD